MSTGTSSLRTREPVLCVRQATRRKGLRLRVENRIEALLRELLDLPAEFTPEAYGRWLEIQDSLRGLYDIKRRFLDAPQLDEPPDNEELLY